MQQRDQFATRTPLRWGCVGGAVEAGESPEVAANRELAEETGIALRGGLQHWLSASFTWSDRPVADTYHLWTAATSPTDDDIALGEGRQIVFVDPLAVELLDLTESAAHFMGRFLRSDRYRELTASRGSS